MRELRSSHWCDHRKHFIINIFWLGWLPGHWLKGVTSCFYSAAMWLLGACLLARVKGVLPQISVIFWSLNMAQSTSMGFLMLLLLLIQVKIRNFIHLHLCIWYTCFYSKKLRLIQVFAFYQFMHALAIEP